MSVIRLKKLEFYVPSEDRERVLAALFAAGAGQVGHYDQCCWFSEGTGQFRPLPQSRPHVGEVGTLHRLSESKVELVFEAAKQSAIVGALKAAHPYETPAYQILTVEL
ncbi:NGG1p interacting factor NIF3 [Ferrimonas gelatinilytica]|uniref:YqfO family protein n=1 Tax=Ferrimonas gelatinilytica TaxID=1255257 RepID=A0ABP9S0S9_9GAMM